MFLLPQVSSVHSFIHIWLIATHGLQHARPPCPSPTPRACSNLCPSSQWCHPAISSSVVFHPTTALICWSPNSQSVGIWRWLDYAGGVSMTGLVPLEEETERLSSSPTPLPSSFFPSLPSLSPPFPSPPSPPLFLPSPPFLHLHPFPFSSLPSEDAPRRQLSTGQEVRAHRTLDLPGFCFWILSLQKGKK